MTNYEITEFLKASQKVLRLDAEIEAEFYYKTLETLTVGQREELVDRITRFQEREDKSPLNAKRLASMLCQLFRVAHDFKLFSQITNSMLTSKHLETGINKNGEFVMWQKNDPKQVLTLSTVDFTK